MTLRRLKVVAMIVPIVAVLVLEVVRYFVIGPVPIAKRILMDVVSIAGILVFTLFIFRFVEGMQERLRRQNEELLAMTEELHAGQDELLQAKIERLGAGTRWMSRADTAGEEILVLEGTLLYGEVACPPLTWLRMPAGQQQAMVSPGGCRYWVKRGHLVP